MLSGDNGILQKATDAKTETERGEVYEQISLATASGEMDYYSNGTNRITAYKSALLNGVDGIDRDNLTDNGSNLITGTVTTKSGKQYDFSVPVPVTDITIAEHKEVLPPLKIGTAYDEEKIKIGDKLTYLANGQSDWIVFGKDKDGNVLLTSEEPISGLFTLRNGPEAWLKYTSYDDETYGLNKACSVFGGIIQGKNIESRSITLEDVNNVAGYEESGFDVYTFGTTKNYSEKLVNYYYPSLEDASFWKKATSTSGTTTFENKYYSYQPSNNAKYICGDSENPFKYYLATKTVSVLSGRADFNVACVHYSNLSISTGCGVNLCRGKSDDYDNYNGQSREAYDVRPIIVLPSDILMEEVSNGVYDIAQ